MSTCFFLGPSRCLLESGGEGKLFAAALQRAEAAAQGPSLGPRAQAYLWATAVLLVAAVLLGAFAYVVVQRGPAWLRPLRRRLPGSALRAEAAARRWLAGRGRRFAALGVALTAFLALTYAFAQVTAGWMQQRALYHLDLDVHQTFEGGLSAPVVRGLRLVTHAGDTLVVVGLTALLALALLWRGERARLAALLATVGGGFAVVWGFKWIFGRARPGAQLAAAAGSSFPSAHAFMSVVFYGFCAYVAWRWLAHPAARFAAAAGFGVLALAVGLSRVLLSVHWVSDVLGGFVLGLLWLLGGLVVARLVAHRQRAPAAGGAAARQR